MVCHSPLLLVARMLMPLMNWPDGEKWAAARTVSLDLCPDETDSSSPPSSFVERRSGSLFKGRFKGWSCVMV